MPTTLTALTLKQYAADAKNEGKRVEVGDAIVPGLWLVSQPTGAQSWAVRYRATDGTPRKLTLGSLSNVLDLKAARERARDELRGIADGNDPAKAKKIAKVQGVPADSTLAAHIETYRQKHVAGLRPTTQSYVNMTLEALQDALPGSELAAIKKSEFVRFIEAPKGDSMKVLRWKVVKCFLRWAANRSDDYVSPLAGYPKPAKEYSRERVLTDAELRTVWKAAVEEGGAAGRLVRLLILTGARRSEIMTLRHSQIHDDTIELPRTKMGTAFSIAITPAVRAVLDECPKSGKYIITGGDKCPGDHSGLKDKIDALAAVDDWTFHDLRRTMRTGLAKLKVDFVTAEFCINHRLRGAAKVYDMHDRADEMREAWERWSRHVAGLVSGPAKAAA